MAFTVLSVTSCQSAPAAGVTDKVCLTSTIKVTDNLTLNITAEAPAALNEGLGVLDFGHQLEHARRGETIEALVNHVRALFPGLTAI